MTVNQICNVLSTQGTISVVLNGKEYNLKEEGIDMDSFLLQTFGDYIVEYVLAIEEDFFCIKVRMELVKATK